ncbi:GlxA family transcriptional regulator [Streptosporangium sp. NPDC001559]|uniref:GlxA family transcriptional regulator n=1 Tax=Streptosporangium sp. NPDC001559 TaxID=3366187 RepID=UPI0036E23115
MSAFRSVVVFATDGVSTFDIGGIGAIFADRLEAELPPFDFTVCAERPGPLRTDLGLSMHVEHGLERLDKAELIILMPGYDTRPEPTPELIAGLRAANRRGAIIAAFCTGTHLLAATGLLDGLRASTHWHLLDDFAQVYPDVTVTADTLYIDEGLVITGAGIIAGIDMCLHLLRREHGAAVANAVARALVAAPHRDGDQAQVITRSVPDNEDELFAGVIHWARDNLDRPLLVNDLAAQALMSPRTFARKFRAAMGTTPHSWLLAQRLSRAEELLETTELRIEEIARLVGYNSVAVFREQFAKRRGLSPRAHRQRYSRSPEPSYPSMAAG